MVSCGGPGCTNRAYKNYNMIALVNNSNTVIITILRHIQKPGIYNTWGMLKTLSNIQNNEAY